MPLTMGQCHPLMARYCLLGHRLHSAPNAHPLFAQRLGKVLQAQAALTAESPYGKPPYTSPYVTGRIFSFIAMNIAPVSSDQRISGGGSVL